MRPVKAICLTLLFGLLSVATVVLGSLLGILLAMITPFLIVFTGLWGVWFATKDYETGSKPD